MNKRAYKIKKKRNIFKSRLFRLGSLFLVLGLGIFWAICFAPFSQIKAVKISGCQKLQPSDLEAAIKGEIQRSIVFIKTQSIVLANSKKITAEILENFPQIEKITLKKNLTGNLEISIKERGPAALLCQYDKCFFIDANGVAYENFLEDNWSGLKINNQALPEAIELGQIVISQDLLSKILKINSIMTSDLGIDLRDVKIVSEQRMNLETKTGWQVYFNLKSDFDWQITELKTILENKISPQNRRNLKYIDLRFDRVFISPEGLVSD